MPTAPSRTLRRFCWPSRPCAGWVSIRSRWTSTPPSVPSLLDAHGVDVFAARNLLAAIDRRRWPGSLPAAELGEPDLGVCLARLMTTAADWRTSLERLSEITLPPAAAAVLDRLKATADLRMPEPSLALTLDPVEHRGFEYYAGLGFGIPPRRARGAGARRRTSWTVAPVS